jgi:hypothetical protein
VKDQVSRQYKTGDKITFYILIIEYLYKRHDKRFRTRWQQILPEQNLNKYEYVTHAKFEDVPVFFIDQHDAKAY